MTDTKREARPQPKHSETDPEQSRRFIETARELGCEDNLGRFDEAVKRIGKARRPVHETEKTRGEKKPE